jgi:hypothetical protein
MTAAAAQQARIDARGTPPTIVLFNNDDLVAGEFIYAYECRTPLAYVVLVDNLGNEVKVNPYFDPDGMFLIIDLSIIAPISGTWVVSIWMASGPHPGISAIGEGSAADYMRIWGADTLDLTLDGSVNGVSIYTPPPGRAFSCRDLNCILTTANGVSVKPKLTLYYQGGYKLIDDVTLDADQPNTRFNYNLRANGDILVPDGKTIRAYVSTAGVAVGSYQALLNIAGYLV